MRTLPEPLLFTTCAGERTRYRKRRCFDATSTINVRSASTGTKNLRRKKIVETCFASLIAKGARCCRWHGSFRFDDPTKALSSIFSLIRWRVWKVWPGVVTGLCQLVALQEKCTHIQVLQARRQLEMSYSVSERPSGQVVLTLAKMSHRPRRRRLLRLVGPS